MTAFVKNDMLLNLLVSVALLWVCCGRVVAAPQEVEASSPWLAVPLVASDPKVGTSGGGLAGYLYRFDEQSPTSTFGVAANYSNTDSYTAGLFARAYFRADRHRLSAGVASGKIRNDYDDFLGTGLPVQTTDELRFGALRYLRRTGGGWFVGAQALATNYTIVGENALTDAVLDVLGLTGFDSNGVGVVVQFDNRDNQESPSRGRLFQISNLAYRKSLGGDESFDVYSTKLQQYLAHGEGHVIAMRAKGRFTDDAPVGGYSTVGLRGYVRGNYLAPNAVSFEIEERYRLRKRWAVAGFAGAACLFDGGSDCDDSSAWYPAAGGGIIFTVKPKEKMVVRLDYAVGKAGNSGLYLGFGHPF